MVFNNHMSLEEKVSEGAPPNKISDDIPDQNINKTHKKSSGNSLFLLSIGAVTVYTLIRPDLRHFGYMALMGGGLIAGILSIYHKFKK